MPDRARTEPTRAQLQAAYERLAARMRRAQRPWPATLDAAMADPAREPLVRGLAVCLARAAAPEPAYQPARTPREPQRPALFRLPAGAFDARRAAANDHTED